MNYESPELKHYITPTHSGTQTSLIVNFGQTIKNLVMIVFRNAVTVTHTLGLVLKPKTCRLLFINLTKCWSPLLFPDQVF